MSNNKKLNQVYRPADQPGFLGDGHIARPVIQVPFPDSDPFILLMDDILDKKDNQPVGGPHPHAGFETVTLVLEGELGDEHHKMKAGDFQLMTAGSGVIHTETIDKKTRMRILQLWLSLPKEQRWTKPRLQDLPLEHVPVFSHHGVSIRLYSGQFAGISSPVKNYSSLIIADINLDKGSGTQQELPASYTSFIYMLDGDIKVGEEQKPLRAGEVGWLDRADHEGSAQLLLNSGENGARLILYAGQPQGDPIISHGPFIADTSEDINRLYREYRQGKMEHIADSPAEQKIHW